MDYIEVATRIAGAENPYSEFEKEAESLNEIEKTSLARALNKQMFLSRLDGRDGDGHLDFEVVTPEALGTHVPKSDTDSKMSKTASVVDTFDKASLITDDMFVLESRKSANYSTPYDTSDLQELTMKTAEVIVEKKLIKTAEELRVYKIEKKAEIEAEITPLVIALVKIARDASETRTVIMHAIDAGQEDLIPSILNMSQSRESDIGKAALCDLGKDKVAKINDTLDNIASKKNIHTLVSAAETTEEVDKISSPLAVRAGVGLAKALFGVGKKTTELAVKSGKKLWSSPKTMTGITAAGTWGAATEAKKADILRQVL